MVEKLVRGMGKEGRRGGWLLCNFIYDGMWKGNLRS